MKEQSNPNLEKAIQRYLEAGGTITKYPPGKTSKNVEYKRKFNRGRKKKNGNST